MHGGGASDAEACENPLRYAPRPDAMAAEFDVSAYAARHTGAARIIRLQYVAGHAAGDAKFEVLTLRLLTDALKETLAVEQYRVAAARLATLGGPRYVYGRWSRGVTLATVPRSTLQPAVARAHALHRCPPPRC